MNNIFLLAVPFLAAILCCVILLKKRVLKNNYDERQNYERERGYGYGFKTLLVINAAIILLRSADIIIMDADILAVVNVYAGIFVFVIYSLIKGAYFGPKNKSVLYPILCVLLGILALFFALPRLSLHPIVQGGKLTTSFVALLIPAAFLLLGVAMLIYLFISKREAEE